MQGEVTALRRGQKLTALMRERSSGFGEPEQDGKPCAECEGDVLSRDPVSKEVKSS